MSAPAQRKGKRWFIGRRSNPLEGAREHGEPFYGLQFVMRNLARPRPQREHTP
ncbi:MAG TPA: hypothetical protein VGA56_11740 [Opitutaceae bacterium]